MHFLDNKQLASYVTMRLGGPAIEIIEALTEQDVIDAVNYANDKKLPILMLGGGTNIIFKNSGFNGVVLLNKIPGLSIDTDTQVVEASGGVVWDEVVKISIDSGLCGIEALSSIPGTCGAAPINNIGAYGQELQETFKYLRAYDTIAQSFVEIKNEDCDFAYRNSRYKNKDYGRFIITKIVLQLKKTPSSYEPPNYQTLLNELDNRGITKPQPKDIREALIYIRNIKLPNPVELPNSGSFYKNPVVDKNLASQLLAKYPDMPHYPQPNGREKLAAGWLIDQAGLKGLHQNGIWIYDKQALVLVNESATDFDDLQKMSDLITKTVFDKYAVKLEFEPEII